MLVPLTIIDTVFIPPAVAIATAARRRPGVERLIILPA
jgi:hypothetical protein